MIDTNIYDRYLSCLSYAQNSSDYNNYFYNLSPILVGNDGYSNPRSSTNNASSSPQIPNRQARKQAGVASSSLNSVYAGVS